MTARTINVSTINQSSFRISTAGSGSGPTLLSETECDRVAAAGSKMGSGTEGRCRTD